MAEAEGRTSDQKMMIMTIGTGRRFEHIFPPKNIGKLSREMEEMGKDFFLARVALIETIVCARKGSFKVDD